MRNNCSGALCEWSSAPVIRTFGCNPGELSERKFGLYHTDKFLIQSSALGKLLSIAWKW